MFTVQRYELEEERQPLRRETLKFPRLSSVSPIKRSGSIESKIEVAIYLEKNRGFTIFFAHIVRQKKFIYISKV